MSWFSPMSRWRDNKKWIGANLKIGPGGWILRSGSLKPTHHVNSSLHASGGNLWTTGLKFEHFVFYIICLAVNPGSAINFHYVWVWFIFVVQKTIKELFLFDFMAGWYFSVCYQNEQPGIFEKVLWWLLYTATHVPGKIFRW